MGTINTFIKYNVSYSNVHVYHLCCAAIAILLLLIVALNVHRVMVSFDFLPSTQSTVNNKISTYSKTCFKRPLS